MYFNLSKKIVWVAAFMALGILRTETTFAMGHIPNLEIVKSTDDKGVGSFGIKVNSPKLKYFDIESEVIKDGRVVQKNALFARDLMLPEEAAGLKQSELSEDVAVVRPGDTVEVPSLMQSTLESGVYVEKLNIYLDDLDEETPRIIVFYRYYQMTERGMKEISSTEYSAIVDPEKIDKNGNRHRKGTSVKADFVKSMDKNNPSYVQVETVGEDARP